MNSGAQITIDTTDGPMPAFEASPEGDPKGGIVVVQEAFGVTEHIEDIARRLADAGWYAVAPAFFHRQGSPVLAYDDFAAVMPVMRSSTPKASPSTSPPHSRTSKPPGSRRRPAASWGSAWGAA